MGKPPIHPVRWQPPPVEALPDFGAATLTVVPLPGEGPEDIVVDADGFMWTGLADGRIVRIASDGSTRVIGDTGGRPLGLAVGRDGRLLICDSPRGLLAMDCDTGVIEELATSIDGRRLIFCSNVVELSDGTVYFTESTAAFTYAHFTGPVLEARGDGSLIRRDRDGTLTTVLTGLGFANGLTPTADGTALVFAETLGRRLSKYWLNGSRAGSVTPLAVNLPGAPDNLSTGSDGRIWCAMFTPANRLADRLATWPPTLRKLLWRLPERVQPRIESIVWAVAFDPDSGDAVAGLRMRPPDFGMVTAAVEYAGRLWLGTIGHSAVAHCRLP
jgi:sugar lactone lactonase YvrE